MERFSEQKTWPGRALWVGICSTVGAREQALEQDLQGEKGWEWLHHTATANRWSSLTRYS